VGGEDKEQEKAEMFWQEAGSLEVVENGSTVWLLYLW